MLRPFVKIYRKLASKGYEEDFEQSLLSRIRPGDVVWDVGANLGFYSRQCAEATGPGGRVIAFEPSPRTYRKLSAELSDWPNITLENVAMSDFDGTAIFYHGESDTGVTDSLAGSGAGVPVRVAKGDSFFPAPCVVKIDVEGFELEVLLGMQTTLASRILRDVFIEVHFLALAKRRAPDNPRKITDLLKNAGFQIKWTDPSHIWASRTLQ